MEEFAIPGWRISPSSRDRQYHNLFLVVEPLNLSNLRDDRRGKHWTDAGNSHEQLGLFPRGSNLVYFILETLDLLIECLIMSVVAVYR
ncbi:MAG: hypothetical protein ABEH88_06565 [Halobacteriales archaeon]